MLARAADGDARRALNMLELAIDLASGKKRVRSPRRMAAEVSAGGLRRFDKQGEAFYDQISALHKSVRGSDPDAALYWLCRMLDGGCDPRYIARRVLRMASEDIGIADPRGLTMALEACEVYERLGTPEGELAIAQAVVFLACAAKSNAVYVAFGEAMDDAKSLGSLEVPLHLRNAPTRLMKNLGLRQGLSLCARRARRLRRRRELFSRGDGADRPTIGPFPEGSKSGSRKPLRGARSEK